MTHRAAITVNRPRDEVERRWRELSPEVNGSVTFAAAPGGRGTEIHLELRTGSNPLRKVTGDDPLQVVRDDLRRFKQLVETGQVTRSDGAPTGHSAKLQPKQRPAQPVEA